MASYELPFFFFFKRFFVCRVYGNNPKNTYNFKYNLKKNKYYYHIFFLHQLPPPTTAITSPLLLLLHNYRRRCPSHPSSFSLFLSLSLFFFPSPVTPALHFPPDLVAMAATRPKGMEGRRLRGREEGGGKREGGKRGGGGKGRGRREEGE